MLASKRCAIGAARFTTFTRDEAGGITVLSLFLFLIMLVGAGFAIDVNNAIQSRNQLQNAADNAGHAALYWRGYESESDSVDKGLELAELNMPKAIFGTVVNTADVEFGEWNGSKREFKVVPGSTTSVRVTTRRTRSGGNGLGTFLMKFAGYPVLDIVTVSVWDATPSGHCPGDEEGETGEGFFAMGRVDIQSNNHYKDGFCIHSETHVEFNNNSIFDPGVTVSMPNENDLVIPASGMDKNSGLEDALDSRWENLNAFFNELPTHMSNYEAPTYSDQLNHITQVDKVMDMPPQSKINQAALSDYLGSVVNIPCKGQTLTIEGTVSDVTIVTTCKVSFAQGAALENGMLLVYNTDKKSVNAAADVRIGDDEYCTNGGKRGAQILTSGGFFAPSQFSAFGANIVAGGDVQIAANANGLGGINVMAGGTLDATSNGDMGFCDHGPKDLFTERNIRMVL